MVTTNNVRRVVIVCGAVGEMHATTKLLQLTWTKEICMATA
jgi:hypothetical protein